MAVRAHTSADLLHVPTSIGRVGEEVKQCAIVPDVVGRFRQFGIEDVRFDPPDTCGVEARPPTSMREMGRPATPSFSRLYDSVGSA